MRKMRSRFLFFLFALMTTSVCVLGAGWILPVLGISANRSASPQIRKLGTQGFDLRICKPISYRKHVRICDKKLKFTANPQICNIAGMFLCHLQKSSFQKIKENKQSRTNHRE